MSPMTMAGGGAMSSVWMRTPGQTWAAAAASFVAMWTLMMAVMMLPSLMPVLVHYHRSAGMGDRTRSVNLTGSMAIGYLVVWGALGLAVFPVGCAIVAAAAGQPTLIRVMPLATGIVVSIAGALQFTAWKTRQLACWREMSASGGPWWSAAPRSLRRALTHGFRLGIHCVGSSAGWTAALLVAGMMDPRAVGLVTSVITAERLAPTFGNRAARMVGAGAVVLGLALIARARGPG